MESRFFDHDGPLAFAHRGGAADGVENSMAAFSSAIDLGYSYLETDAHVTADGVVVAFHDDELDRVTDASGVVGDLPWAAVREARIGGREAIPTMEELLAAWPDVRVNIDAKHDAVVEPLADMIRKVGATDRVCLGSFSDRRVKQLRRLLPEAATGVGSRGVARLRAGKAGGIGSGPAGDCAQVPPRAGRVPLVTRRFVEYVHARGLHVHVWTIDDADEMTELLDLGVDGIMTDRPSVLRDVLQARDEWQS